MTTYTARTFTDAREFLVLNEQFLLRHESVNCIILGIALAAAGRTDPAQVARYETINLYSVEESGAPALAALHTPPFTPLLSAGSEAAASALADHIHSETPTASGVNGPAVAARAFAARWANITGAGLRHDYTSIVHELTEVVPPREPSGHLRLATQDDISAVAEFLDGFNDETGHDPSPVPGLEAATSGVETGRYYLWDNSGPVSLAGRARTLPNGAVIGPVYTPPAHRNRGYASALVAELSQLILDEGKQFACLFTNAANPTSNAIYRQIGYRPITEFKRILFQS